MRVSCARGAVLVHLKGAEARAECRGGGQVEGGPGHGGQLARRNEVPVHGRVAGRPEDHLVVVHRRELPRPVVAVQVEVAVLGQVHLP